jgi:PIN domain nuclease of toxin-antitoxin system
MSSVNLAEVATFFTNRGVSVNEVRDMLMDLDLHTVPFDDGMAYDAAALRLSTRQFGLSLADRACLGLALREGLSALTADRVWSDLDIGVEVRLIRVGEQDPRE